MNLLRGIPVALSIYTKIPVNIKNWKDGDMRRGFAFFPFIGVIVGAVFFWLWYAMAYFYLPSIFISGMLFFISFVVTGALHYDGFMDTEDAIASYADKDKKLEILKDPHAGAFAIAAMVRHAVFYVSLLYLYVEKAGILQMVFISAGFVLSRAVCGLSSVMLKKAREEGMLYEETKSGKGGLYASFIFWIIASLIVMGFMDIRKTAAAVIIMVLFIIFYRHMTYKNFGGVTGDTAGYFVMVSEGLLLATVFI